MTVAPPLLPTCPTCQTALDANGTCPRCRAPEDWNDQIDGLDFVVRRLIDWHKGGQLTDRQMQTLSDHYAKRREALAAAASTGQVCERDAKFPPRDECWSCGGYLYTNTPYCQECGAPIADAGVRSLRYWRLLLGQLQTLEEAGWLTLRQAHEFVADTQERIDALQRKLERERAPFVLPVDEEPQPRRHRRPYEDEIPIENAGPRRTFLEALLDPQSIQWLLAAGGALIVLGVVIWLASLDLFKEPGVVAIGLGLGNLALLGCGWALMLRTNHQHAGRALTLLACLVMPLNLWFYEAHGLMKLGDHLWIAALICCVIYTASALFLKDSLFVYVLVGGITLTGMLILAEVHHFGEILAPTTFLIVLGLICLHAERAFPPIDSPFSRERFGMAFYWCSVALFGFGLLLLLGAQLIGWGHHQIFQQVPFDVVDHKYLPWTLALVLAGAYAYIYSDLVVRKIGVYIYLAAITVLWAEIHVLLLMELARVQEVLIIVLALTALVANVLQTSFRERHGFLRVVPPLGLLLSVLPLMLGLLLHFRATNRFLHDMAEHEITWLHVGAMAITALCCRAGAHLYRHKLREVSVFYFFATAVATLLFAASLTWMLNLRAWETEAPLITIVPILYLGASYLYRGHTPEKPLIWAGHAAVGIMLFFSIWVVLGLSRQVPNPVEGDTRHLLLSLFCLEVAIFYGLATYLQRTNWTMYFGAVTFCGAIWQLLMFFQTPDELYIVAFALAGFGLLLLYRFGVFEHLEMAGLDRGIFQSANALTTLGFASGALLALSRLAQREEGEGKDKIWIILLVLIFLTIISLASIWLVQHQVWRRVHIVFSIVNGILLVLIIHKLSTLPPWQRLEILTIVVGLIMLVFGYIGWFRETERSSDLVSMAFVFGSLGLAVPLFLASSIHRFGLKFSAIDELGLIASCLALFASGVVSRIKATTIVGAFTLVLYVLMVLVYMHRFLKDTVIIGIYLTLGGALLFGTGLFLSVYRDRLLALPAKVRRREGIFRIFDWR
jgi:hypothetical protein